MMPLDTIPTRQEVDDQLEWMLSTKRFRNATNQSDFLSLVVNRALQGKQTSGSVIAKRLFPNKFVKLVSGDVRATAHNLRATLKKYYDQEGNNDLVVIRLPEPPEDKRVKLPEGQAYTPEFTYNPNHEVAKQFGLGMFFLAKRGYEDCNKAFRHFTNACKLARYHYGAYIGAAEAVCRLAEWEWWLSAESKSDSIYSVATLLDLAQDCASGFWRLHAVGGFMFTLDEKPDEATREFETARGLNRMHTESYPPYFKYLVSAGNVSEGLRLAKRHLDTNFLDLTAHISYAETLIRAGQFADAIPVLESAEALDAGNASIHCWLARIRVAQGRLEDALGHMLILAGLSDEMTAAFTANAFAPVIEAWPEKLKETWRTRLLEAGIFGPTAEDVSREEQSLLPTFERVILALLPENKDHPLRIRD